MSADEARDLAAFVKDHDKRFVASVQEPGDDGGPAAVRLVRADDGAEVEPLLLSAEQYRSAHIDGDSDPGPTVRAAWESWRQARHRAG